MSEEADETRSRLSPRQRRVLKWMAIGAVVPSVVLFTLVAFFVARTEYMHGESRCPWVEVESRPVGSHGRVVDEGRSCQEGVEEHRWTLHRDDGTRRELGRRRLMTSQFERYDWTASAEDGSIVVVVRNDDVEDATFRETAPPHEKRR